MDAGKITILNGPEGGTGGRDVHTTGTRRLPRTRWRRSSTRLSPTARRSTLSWLRTTARRSASSRRSPAKSFDPYPPVSGQDGDPANLNNVAKGLQYVDVWKNANELGKATGAAALALCANPDMTRRCRRDRRSQSAVATPGGNTVNSFILKPTPLTAENLQLASTEGGSPRKTCALAWMPRQRPRPASDGPDR